MVAISPNCYNKEVPRDPVTDSCGIAIQNSMATKYLIMSALAAH
jgi:hypothetical protein